MEDRRIVELFWQRDELALKETDKKYGDYVFKIAQNILEDNEDSIECVNDTYMRAWNTMPNNRPDKLNLYLGKIARGIAIDFYRKKSAQKRISTQYSISLSELEECVGAADNTESIVEGEQLLSLINRFVMSLKVIERNVFICRYYFFDAIEDISYHTGYSVSKIKSMLLRTRNKLKKFIESEGFSV